MRALVLTAALCALLLSSAFICFAPHCQPDTNYGSEQTEDSPPDNGTRESGTRGVPYGTAVYGHISQDTTWILTGTSMFSPYRAIEHVIVDPGVTLTIEPGVSVQFLGTSLFVEGRLVAEGAPLNNIKFTTDKYPRNYSDWGSVRFNSSSTGTMKYCDVMYSSNGIVIDSARVGIDQSNIYVNTNQGISIENYSSVSLTNTTVWSSYYAGAVCYWNSTLSVDRCSFSGLRHGVIAFGRSEVRGSAFTLCDVGVLCLNSSTTVSGNDFTDCVDGLFAFESDPVIRSNEFIGCSGNGTRFYNSSAIFTDNSFANNGASVDIPYNSKGVIANMSGNFANGIDLSAIYFLGSSSVSIANKTMDSGWGSNYYGNITAQGSLTFYDCGSVEISNSTVRYNWNGIFLVGSKVHVRDTLITGMVEGAVTLDQGSEAVAVNVSHDSPMLIRDEYSTAEEWEYLQVHVRNETHVPIEGASVSVLEEGVDFASAQTGPDGNTLVLTVMDAFYTSTGSVEPMLTINVTSGGLAFGDNPKQIHVNQSTLLVFTDLGDIWAPAVNGSTLVSGDEAVPASSNIIIAFSEQMNVTSVEKAFSVTPPVAGRFVWDGWNLTFVPAVAWNYSTEYTITIGTNATDVRGNTLASPYVLTFTTEESPTAHQAEYIAMYAVIGVVIALSVVGAVWYLRRGRDTGGNGEEGRKDEDSKSE